jgi:hypothetical protein
MVAQHRASDLLARVALTAEHVLERIKALASDLSPPVPPK